MRAIVVTRYGGPDVLQVQQQPNPQARPGQVLVDAEAIGVNYRDIYERQGPGYGEDPPFVAGVEGAGTIVGVGGGVSELSVGDRVAWSAAQGSYADRVAVDAERAVPVPNGVSSELAAAALLQGMTAQYLATDTYPVRPGDDVLVHAGAGGVGLLLTQIVKQLGGRVIATTSTDEKAELAREAGAEETIGYDNFAEQVRELTGGEGVAVVYDGIGKTTFEGSLSSLKPRGYMVLYGAASGQAPPVEPRRLLGGGSLFFTRPTLQHYTLTRPELLGRASELFGWVVEGKVHVRIGGRYALEDASRAQGDLAARATTGKLILIPSL
jgi:NADPH2:quinone reductase